MATELDRILAGLGLGRGGRTSQAQGGKEKPGSGHCPRCGALCYRNQPMETVTYLAGFGRYVTKAVCLLCMRDVYGSKKPYTKA